MAGIAPTATPDGDGGRPRRIISVGNITAQRQPIIGNAFVHRRRSRRPRPLNIEGLIQQDEDEEGVVMVAFNTRDLKCPLCFELLTDAQEVCSAGHHLCFSCLCRIMWYRIDIGTFECPICKRANNAPRDASRMTRHAIRLASPSVDRATNETEKVHELPLLRALHRNYKVVREFRVLNNDFSLHKAFESYCNWMNETDQPRSRTRNLWNFVRLAKNMSDSVHATRWSNVDPCEVGLESIRQFRFVSDLSKNSAALSELEWLRAARHITSDPSTPHQLPPMVPQWPVYNSERST